MFSFQPLLVGGNPFTTTSIYSLIQHLERTSGIHFAMGGTGALVAALVQLMYEERIELSLNSPVSEVLITDGRARGVRLSNGQEIMADVVVANADAPALYKKLVPSRWRRKWNDRRIESRRYSMGLFVLYLGTRRTYPHLAHHTIVLGQQYRELLSEIFEQHKFSDDISLYLHAPTRTDPSLAPPGCESLYALVPVPNLQANIDWAEKGPELEKLTIDLLERTVCPGLRDEIELKFYVTPEHSRRNFLRIMAAVSRFSRRCCNRRGFASTTNLKTWKGFTWSALGRILARVCPGYCVRRKCLKPTCRRCSRKEIRTR